MMDNKKETVPKRIKSVADTYPELNFLMSKDENSQFQAISFREGYEKIKIFGSGFHALGVRRGDHIGIISDNRWEWMITDLALLGLGAVDVPRGSDSTTTEISYILKHADCKITLAENAAQVDKILATGSELSQLEKIIVFDRSFDRAEYNKKNSSLTFHSFDEVFQKGQKAMEKKPHLFETEMAKGEADDIATLIYTSGTTGEPKGVMLTHCSFLFQLDRIGEHLDVRPGQIMLCVLPVWHSFERTVEYILLNFGGALAYSKPIGKVMLDDMQKVRPQWIASVPRIWEGVRAAVFRNVNKEGGIKKVLFYFFVGVGQLYATFSNMFKGLTPQFTKRNRTLDKVLSALPLMLLIPLKLLGDLLVFSKIKKKLGGRFQVGISGGGALPGYVDSFFQAVGITLLEGYGLTETAPILSVRKQYHPVSKTVGPLLPDVQYRLLDKQGNQLPSGEKGVLWVKSAQIMEGYYKRPEATAAVMQDGWLNTGDIAIFTHNGEFKIIGRVKETIVLNGGENIEPAPLEEKILQSDYINHVMVVGQDRKFLGALVVPNKEMVEQATASKDISYVEWEELLNNPEIQAMIHDEIQSLVNPKQGFRHYERIFRFKLLAEPFVAGRELTHSLKVRRNVVAELYKKEIHYLYT